MRSRAIRSLLGGVALALAVALTGCQWGAGLTVEQSGGLTYVRAHGPAAHPDMFYEARIFLGEDKCLYVEFAGEKPGLLVLNDTTTVTPTGLVTGGGREVTFGEAVKVSRTYGDHYDTRIDGVDQCTEWPYRRGGVQFDD